MQSNYVSDESRFACIDKLLDRPGPYTDTDQFEGAEAVSLAVCID